MHIYYVSASHAGEAGIVLSGVYPRACVCLCVCLSAQKLRKTVDQKLMLYGDVAT